YFQHLQEYCYRLTKFVLLSKIILQASSMSKAVPESHPDSESTLPSASSSGTAPPVPRDLSALAIILLDPTCPSICPTSSGHHQQLFSLRQRLQQAVPAARMLRRKPRQLHPQAQPPHPHLGQELRVRLHRVLKTLEVCIKCIIKFRRRRRDTGDSSPPWLGPVVAPTCDCGLLASCHVY
ncbi:hypothetical protein C8Q72DRAFT_859699, partial [Fomitopsis betulina]